MVDSAVTKLFASHRIMTDKLTGMAGYQSNSGGFWDGCR
jgi:hypothetical protein